MMGYRLVEWEEDRAVVELTVEPCHLNRTGIVHGAVFSALLDTALGFSGVYCAAPERIRRAVTLSLSTQFVSQAHTGLLRATGIRIGGGSSIFFAEGRVESGADKRLLATGSGTFRYRRDSRKPEGAPR